MSPREPHFGHTRHGLAVHAHVTDHHPDGSAYQRFNKKVALWLVSHVGSMTCFWVFWVMGFTILPSVLHSMGVLGSRWIGPAFMLGFGFNLFGTWLISTCFQAVLLPGIMVGQSLQNQAADARAAKQFEDLEEVRDWLDLRTQGGLTEVLAAVTKLGDQVADLGDIAQKVMAARVEHESGVAADAKAARTAAESAFVATQALAAVATAKPGPTELAAAVAENTEAVRQIHQAVTAPAGPPDPGPAAVKAPKDGSEGEKAAP